MTQINKTVLKCPKYFQPSQSGILEKYENSEILKSRVRPPSLTLT